MMCPAGMVITFAGSAGEIRAAALAEELGEGCATRIGPGKLRALAPIWIGTAPSGRREHPSDPPCSSD